MLRNLARKARRGRGPHNNRKIIVRFTAAVARRAGAFFCSFLLLVVITLFPVVRARATVAAGALTAVGFAVTVTAFLNLAGIYPFNPDTGEGMTFPEWTDEALQKLVDLYNVAHASAPLTQQTIKSYAIGATIAVVNEGWNRLRDFVDWVKAEYAPADNAEGVQIGEVSSAYVTLPSTTSSAVDIRANGLRVWRNSAGTFFYGLGSAAQTAYVFYTFDGSFFNPVVVTAPGGSSASVWYTRTGYNTSSSASVATYIDDLQVYYGLPQNQVIPSSVFVEAYVPFVAYQGNYADTVRYFFGAGPSLDGIVADTATVTTPAAPAADSEFTGMQVAGLGQGATADALEDVIEGGVQNRERPTVRQVEIEIQSGTEVDSETGEITENPVVVTPADIPVVAENYVLPASITTVFPFSIPWDVMRIFQALNAEPQRIDVTVTFPFPDVALGNEVSFRLVFPPDELEENETFQTFMTWFRRVILIVMCVYATWGLASFIKR